MDETLPILLGEAPSRRGDRFYHFPLSGPPARVLCNLAGIPPQPDGSTYGRWTWALYERFECQNLFERYAQAEPWSVPRARQTAGRLAPELAGRVVVLLGRRVQTAVLGAHGVAAADLPGFHEWESLNFVIEESSALVVAIPHPSGLNRALNDPRERESCGQTLRTALETAQKLAL